MQAFKLGLQAICFLMSVAPSISESTTGKKTVNAQVTAQIGACKIQYRDIYSGYRAFSQSSYYGKHPYYVSSDFGISWTCERVDDINAYAIERGAAYDTTQGHWVKDFRNLASDYDREGWRTHAKIGDIQTVNASGYYIISMDTIGEETKRRRQLSSCVFHGQLALCSLAEAGALAEPKKSLVPHIVRLLKTIEFIDE